MTDDIERMTDEELVRACAEAVMGNVVRFAYKDWWIGEAWPECRPWRPLKSWDDCMMVVNAMRAKGWGFSISAYPAEKYDFVNFYNPSTEQEHEVAYVFGDERRAILRAALAAVRSKP